jgi:hypothetical protein
MSALERYVRAAQAPEKTEKKLAATGTATASAGAKIGRTGKAVIKPKGQLPFDETDGRSTQTETGAEVIIDISNTEIAFVNSIASVVRIRLRCSGYDAQAPGNRVLHASVFAQISGGPVRVEIAGANDTTYLYALGLDPEVGVVRGPASVLNPATLAHARAAGGLSAAAHVLTAGGRSWTGDAVPTPIPDSRVYPFAARLNITFIESLGLWRIDSPESWAFG